MIRTTQIGPYTLHGDDSNQTHLCQLENGLNYEPHVRRVLERVKPRLMLDIGANVGLHALSAASLGAVVHAFEASRYNHHLLLRNIKDNSLRDRIYPYRVAIAERKGHVYHNDDFTNITCRIGDSPDCHHVIDTASIDSFGFDHVKLIKLDVEGFELFALRGMAELVERCHPTIIFEACSTHLAAHQQTLPDIFDWFEQRDYHLTDLTGNPTITDWLAEWRAPS